MNKYQRLAGYIFLSLFFLALTPSITAQSPVELTGWKFRQAGTIKWYDAVVPGCVHTDLLNNKLIEDPFYRTNEQALQWIDKVNWEYKTSFRQSDLPASANQYLLVFEGIDTYADVYLNGQKLFTNTNMFVKSEIPIDKGLLKQENELVVYFRSPVMTGLQRLQEYQLPLPADNDQSENGGMGPNKVSVFTRKAPYHYGWDWGPRLVTSGIWRSVYFKAADNSAIADLYIKQGTVTAKSASMEAQVELTKPSSGNYQVNILVNGEKIASGKVDTRALNGPAGKTAMAIPFEIINPKLWWPNGHGEQAIYTISAELSANGKVIDRKRVATGIRKIALVRKADKEGETFYFEVNGKPIFAKGANYIPNDVFPSRVDSAKYEYIIASAAKANMNMLRIWGGGIYENDIFYRLCDKYGIMIWQDFMFACAMYPGNDEFLNEVTLEADQNIRRLRNHACIALWCGNNEIEQAWAQYEENRGWGWKQRYNANERAVIWKAYDTIFHSILPRKVKELNPEIAYWHSSPSAGMGKLANHTNTSGDMHYWGVWHGNEPVESFKKYRSRFMSEYGFQSFPEYESVKKYTKQEDWDIYSSVMLAHQRSMIGNQRINDYLSAWYNPPQSFEDFLYVSQLLQAEAIKTAIHAHRTDRPYCMGTLYWQLNDCWPVASWSGMDYYGQWKALHYFAKEAFKNQIITVDQTDDKINVYGISDTDGMSASLRINLMDFNGNTIWNRMIKVKMNPNASTLLTSIDLEKLPAMQHKTDALISLSLIRNEKVVDSEIFYLDKPKNLKLPNPEVSIHIRQKPGKFDIEITSKALCKNLMLISEGNAYSFPENFFDILPGETKVVTVNSMLNYDEFEKKLSYIHLQQACEIAK